MTKEDFLNDGWKPQQCKIGTLYFKDCFFARVLNDGKVSVSSVHDDMHTLAIVETKEEIDNTIKNFYRDVILELENKLETIKKDFFEKYGESI